MPPADQPSTMPRQQARGERLRRSDLATALAETPSPPAEALVEAVHVRNYDHRESHSVAVRLDDADGREVAAERHALAPGQSARTTAALEPGEYDLRVRVDGVERRRRTCRLGPGPADTAVVELGNGAVSVTTGAAGSLAE